MSLDLLIRALLRQDRATHAAAFLCLALLALLGAAFLGLSQAMQGRSTDDSDRLLAVFDRTSPLQQLPLAHVRVVAAVPGVEAVTYASRFGGYFRERGNPVAAYAVDAASYLTVNPDISLTPEAARRWRDDRGAIIVGKDLLARYGWRVGDTVQLGSTAWQRRDGAAGWPMRIAGSYDVSGGAGNRPNAVYMHYDYLDMERTGSQSTIGIISVRVADGAEPAVVAAAIDAATAGLGQRTTTLGIGSVASLFAMQYSDLLLLLRTFFILAFAASFVLACTSLWYLVGRRAPALATQRCMGAGAPAAILRFTADAGLVFILAALAGTAVGVLLFAGLLADGVTIPAPQGVPALLLLWLQAAGGALLPVLAALVTGALLALRAFHTHPDAHADA